MADASSCPACTAASTNAFCGLQNYSCRFCRVRALACGIEFFAASDAGRLTPEYRAALITQLAAADIAAAHEEVKTEHARIKALQSTTKGG